MPHTTDAWDVRHPVSTAKHQLVPLYPTERAQNHYTYDTLDRLLKRSDALGGATQLSYDANDNLVQATDRKGRSPPSSTTH